jgi:quercetin dioxygenase-like cupin family protein
MALQHAAPSQPVDLAGSSFLPPRKTAALVKTDRFEAVRLYIAEGEKIPAHQVDGQITLHCLSGSVVIGMEADVELHAGDWMYLDRAVRHSVRALEESYLLLTILFDH